MDERLRRQLDFILEIDKEKNIFRQTHLSGGGRRENDAEHAWHMAIMAYLLKDYANEEVDIAKVMIMCLIHDIVEIEAGDTYAYDEEGLKTQKAREDAAKEHLFGMLPDDQKAFGQQFCERYRNLSPVLPDVLLHDADRFDWGGGCEIAATPGHTPGHIAVRALSNEYMITGDAAVLAENELAVANPEFCLDIKAAERSLEKIARFRCRRYICYHGGILER